MKRFLAILIATILVSCSAQKGEDMIEAKTLAPDFTLMDQDGKSHTLSQYKGKNVLVYFYPMDDTPGCTKEACSIRDSYQELTKLDLQVFGISPDSIESHKKFAEKYKLPFTLLSDPNKEVVGKYDADGAWVQRISYLINKEGEIIKTYPKVSPATHAAEIYEDLRNYIES